MLRPTCSEMWRCCPGIRKVQNKHSRTSRCKSSSCGLPGLRLRCKCQCNLDIQNHLVLSNCMRRCLDSNQHGPPACCLLGHEQQNAHVIACAFPSDFLPAMAYQIMASDAVWCQFACISTGAGHNAQQLNSKHMGSLLPSELDWIGAGAS